MSWVVVVKSKVLVHQGSSDGGVGDDYWIIIISGA
jgi:hypothetical protein